MKAKEIRDRFLRESYLSGLHLVFQLVERDRGGSSSIESE